MLQCRQATYGSTMADATSDVTVLDRQRSWIKQQLQQQTSSSSSYHNTGQLDNSSFQHIASYLDGDDTTNKKHNPIHSDEILGWPDVAVGSHPMLVDMVSGGGNGGEIASPTSKKRKGDETRGGKVSEDKAAAGIKESGNRNSEGKENMKAAVAVPPPPQKTDYIHVRARRGQATDSHSLAERVRREKISERMKYLQDLVPGCNRITGKAGMLDEIINYVQSLQRQVEFLSMKLATVHPRLDFSIDQLLSKEINPANSTSFPTTVGMSSSEIVDPSYLQFNPMGDAVSCCGIETPVNPSELALRRNATMLVTVPAADSCLNVHGSSSFPWDNDMQNLYNVDFHQGRGFPLSFQFFQGNMMPNNPKTEL